MPADSIFAFTRSTANAITDLLRRNKQRPVTEMGVPVRPVTIGNITHVVKVTSSSPDGEGLYNCDVQTYTLGAGGGWQSLFSAFALGVNGEELARDKRYVAKLVSARDNNGVFACVAAVGDDTRPKIVRVSNDTPDSDGLYDGYVQAYDSQTNTFRDEGTLIKIRDANAPP